MRFSRLVRFAFAEAAAPVWLACALLALEVIPLYAWLLIFAAYGGGGAERVAVPLWLLTLAALGYCWIGARTAGRRQAAGTLLAIVLGAGVSLLALALSSAASAATTLLDLSWLSRLGDDLVASGPAASEAVLVIAVFIYLGWRALSIGRRLPDVNGAKTRFAYSFGALALASVTVVGLPAASRPLVVGWLSLLLPLDVFAGLLASALARRQEAQATRAQSSQVDSIRWMGAALVVSGLVVLIALVLGALINLDGVTALLSHLGPVGHILGGALNGTLLLVEQVLAAFFDAPLGWLQHAFSSAGTTTTQRPTLPPASNQGPTSADLGRWRFLAVAVMSVAISVALILLALGFMRLLRREDDTAPEGVVDEERSALDGSALLREQVRELLGRFQRGPRAAPDVIPNGSVRRLYRELLSAASTRGLGRRKAETPDEFAPRLAGALGDDRERDAAALTDAYDTARYGEREPDPAHAHTLQEATQRLVRRVSAR
jgi:hypothetical protein